MRYDLLLQSMLPGAPFDSARVEALLEARGARVLPGGGRDEGLQPTTKLLLGGLFVLLYLLIDWMSGQLGG